MIAKKISMVCAAVRAVFDPVAPAREYAQWTPEEIAHLMDKGRAPVVINGIDWGAAATSSTGAECEMKYEAAIAQWRDAMVKMQLKAVESTPEEFECEYLSTSRATSTPIATAGKNGPNSRQFE